MDEPKPDPIETVRAAMTPQQVTRSQLPSGKYRQEAVVLPEACPVKPLGKSARSLFFLDALGQLHELPAERLGRPNIVNLFVMGQDWLYDLWPRFKRVGDGDEMIVDDWILSRAQETLVEACALGGMWSPHLHTRGRGAWALEDGQLLLHCGRALFVSDGRQLRPGMLKGQPHIYPAAEALPEPLADKRPKVDGRTGAAELLALLESWCWKRDFDARLLLGWIASALVGGALKVRPMVWVTGPRGSGKSAITGEGELLDTLFGGSAIVTTNTTAAGLFQKLRYDALPVVVDEIEAKRGNAKTMAVIELMRQGFSGGALLRGGADHDGVEFRARSAMCFSSILIPPLLPQDQSRLAILALEPFGADAVEPARNAARLRLIGQAMLRRWLERWDEWPQRLEAWRAGLKAQGHDGRGQDAFGTLLAAADIMLTDTLPGEDEVRAICAEMRRDAMLETRSDGDTVRQCVAYAMSRTADRYRGGEVMTIGEWVRAVLGRIPPEEYASPPMPAEAARVLARYGLRVVLVHRDANGMEVVSSAHKHVSMLGRIMAGSEGEGWVGVAFANGGDGILTLFEGSDWEGTPGARNPYTQALERMAGAYTPAVNVRIGSASGRVVVVPVDECLALEE